MASWNVLQEKFTEGEISPRYLGQVGSERVSAALQHIENGLVVPQGPVISRPGTTFLHDLELPAENTARMWTFVSPENKEIVAVFSDEKVSIISPVNGEISAPVAGYIQQLKNPFFETGLSDWTHSGEYFYQNVRYMVRTSGAAARLSVSVDYDHPPQGVVFREPFIRQSFITGDPIVNLNFTADSVHGGSTYLNGMDGKIHVKIGTTPTGSEIADVYLPAGGAIGTSVNIPGGVSGEIWLTVSLKMTYTGISNLALVSFESRLDNVQLYAQKQSTTSPVDLDTPYADAELEDLQFVQSPFDNKELICLHPDHPPQMFYYDPLAAIWKFEDYDFATSPTQWGDVSGWPSIGAGFQGRLYLSGVKAHAETIWASKAGDWKDFALTPVGDIIGDADPIEVTNQERGIVTWLLGFKTAMYGTEKGEYVISATNEVVTPTDIALKLQTVYGSQRMPQRIPIGSSVLLPAAGNTTLRMYRFNRDSAGYIAPDIVLKAEHLGHKIFRHYFYTRDPHQIVWCVMLDGSLTVMSFDEDSGLAAWSRITTNGTFKDGCVITGEDGKQVVLFVVERIIEGVANKYVEKIDPLRDISQWKYTDSTVRIFTNGTIGEVGGVSHMEGKEVSVFLDGSYDGKQTVKNGVVNVRDRSTYIDVGLAYDFKLINFPPPSLDPNVGLTAKKRFSKVGVRGVFSRPPIINGQRPPDRSPQATMDVMEPADDLLDTFVVDLETTETSIITIEEPLPIAISVAGIFGKLTSNQL